MSTDVRLVQLHLEQRARLERMVLYRLRDPDLAADLVSEAFLRLHRRLRDGVAPTDEVAWLTRVTINLALSEGRHRAVVQRTADRLPRPKADVGPEEVALGRERAAQLAVALDRLSRFDRRLLLGRRRRRDRRRARRGERTDRRMRPNAPASGPPAPARRARGSRLSAVRG